MAGRAPKVHRLRPPGRRSRFAVVAARFNERMSQRLVEGALEAFRAAGVAGDAVEVHWVPGSFELPQAAGHLALTGRYAGIVCVGVVIRGQTPHFEHVAREAAAGIRHVALTTGVPVGFGVVTALSEEQAGARAGGGGGWGWGWSRRSARSGGGRARVARSGTAVRRRPRPRSRWPSGSAGCVRIGRVGAPCNPRGPGERSPGRLAKAARVGAPLLSFPPPPPPTHL